MTTLQQIEAAPKVELHLHLEGAIPLVTLWEIVQSYGGDSEVGSLAELEARFAYTDFEHFISVWWWMTGYLRTEDDFTHIAEAVARSLAAQNILYAEASFSPSDFERHGLTTQQLAAAIRTGLDRVGGTQVVLNVDLVRDTGIERGTRVLEAVIDVKDDCDIRGITIGGSEQGYPPEPYGPLYARARNSGLRLTAHAGEAAGPESVWGALDALGVERIGHGVRAIEDAELFERLVSEQIPLEMCPTSNLRTGVVAGWEEHPVGEFLSAGANVTISSDDPTFFDCTLSGDLHEVTTRFDADVEELTVAAIDASWMTNDERRTMLDRVASHHGTVRNRTG